MHSNFEDMGVKIVYVVGGLYLPNGMSQVLSEKINYLAENTDFELYMILTERANEPWYYNISPKVKSINFDINFDELDTMPILKKIFAYYRKQRKYRTDFTKYLMEIQPDITISTLRREINFINDIPDGSKKIGEIHFGKSHYRVFNKQYLPAFINRYITSRWNEKLKREISKLDKFIVLTHEDKEAWGNLNNIKVIHNPLTYFPSESSTCSNKNVIAVGRYTWQKGFDILIESWSIVYKKHQDWKLNIYGGGDSISYQKMAEQKGLSTTSISCNEAVKDIYNRYLDSSFFILSSRFEGFGLVIAEAMSCGLPTVSFACPCGPKDIIRDGEDGFLVENGNIKDLADKICYLIEHEDERKSMGKKAKEDVKRFDINIIMQQWIDLFNKLMEEKQ